MYFDGFGMDEGTTDAKVIKSPDQPSSREIHEHEVTHVPFRSWRKFGVQRERNQ